MDCRPIPCRSWNQVPARPSSGRPVRSPCESVRSLAQERGCRSPCHRDVVLGHRSGSPKQRREDQKQDQECRKGLADLERTHSLLDLLQPDRIWSPCWECESRQVWGCRMPLERMATAVAVVVGIAVVSVGSALRMLPWRGTWMRCCRHWEDGRRIGIGSESRIACLCPCPCPCRTSSCQRWP